MTMEFLKKLLFALILCSSIGFIKCFNRKATRSNYLDANIDGHCSAYLLAADDETFTVPLERNCEEYIYTFTSSTKQSIISIVSAIKGLNETVKNNNESREWNLSEDELIVGFFETTSNEKTRNWKITYKNVTEKHLYLSRTSSLMMKISIKGNWSEYELTFRYKEFKFVADPESKQCNELNGVITSQEIPEIGQYRPNSVTIYSLTKAEGTNVSSIELTLSFLDIDFGVGEYILIGAGKDVFQGPPPLFITSQKKMAKYLVNDENAYVVFVSGSTRLRHRGFHISYQQLNAKILVPKEEFRKSRGDDVLQSMPICFYNVSVALKEFNNPDKEKAFLKFREEFMKVAIEYAKNKKLSAARYLNASYVQVFRISGVIQFKREEDDMIDEVLYAMMKVRGAEEGDAAFNRKDLKDIIDLFDETSSKVLGYKAGKCPPEYLYSKWWDIGIYASLPAFFALFIVMWAWKRKIFQESCFRNEDKLKKKITKQFEKGMKEHNENATRMRGNDYDPSSHTVPKVQLFTTTGRRYTLDPRNSFAINLEDEYSNGDLESPSNLNNEEDSLHRAENLQIREYTHHLEDTSLIPRSMKHEIDHVYDSPNPMDSSKDDHQTTETRL